MANRVIGCHSLKMRQLPEENHTVSSQFIIISRRPVHKDLRLQ